MLRLIAITAITAGVAMAEKTVCEKCAKNKCLGKGACLLIEPWGFTCEVDPDYFTEASVCEGDIGHFCESCEQPECKAYLYQHFDFGGDKKLYTTGEYERVWSNDVVSSIKVVGDGCKAIVYQHFGFGGWSVELPAGSYDQDKLSSMGFKNDEMSSLKVIQGPTSDGSTTRRLSEMMEAKALEMIDAHAAPVNELMPPPPAF